MKKLVSAIIAASMLFAGSVAVQAQQTDPAGGVTPTPATDQQQTPKKHKKGNHHKKCQKQTTQDQTTQDQTTPK